MGKIENSLEKAAAVPAAAPREKTMMDYVKQMAPAIKAALPSVMTPERFSRITLSALSSTPQLAKTTPQSFLAAMMTAAQLGLEPNTPLGQAYLIPYNNKGRLECQFQLGYKGLIDLAYRSGEVSIVQAHTVYEHDEFSFSLGLDPQLVHVPAKRDRGEPVWFYAMFKTKGGGYGFEVMSVEDVRAHAKRYSKSYSSGFSPWATSFEEMAKKTVLKRALKYAPLKSDFVRGLSADETVKAELSDDMTTVPVVYVDADTGEVTEPAGEEGKEQGDGKQG